MKHLSGLLFGLLASHVLSVSAQTCDYEHTPVDTPDARYQIDNDGTVTDLNTHLMWQICPAGLSGKDCTNGKATEMNWQQALLYAEEQRGRSWLDTTTGDFLRLRSYEHCLTGSVTIRQSTSMHSPIHHLTGIGRFHQ